jgi:cytochrome c biogenesis protein CcmG, thiol:disulfide interchange protein DsbE
VAAVTVCLIAVLATRSAGENTTAASPLLGKPAPAIDSTSLGGAPVTLASFRGRYVVVNFFASWCQPCQVEEPQLVEFAAEHRGAAAAVLGVVFSDSTANAAAFARSNAVTWPVVTDPGGRIALAYGVADPPDSFVVAPDGRVVADVVGGVTASGLEQLIDQFQAEDP